MSFRLYDFNTYVTISCLTIILVNRKTLIPTIQPTPTINPRSPSNALIPIHRLVRRLIHTHPLHILRRHPFLLNQRPHVRRWRRLPLRLLQLAEQFKQQQFNSPYPPPRSHVLVAPSPPPPPPSSSSPKYPFDIKYRVEFSVTREYE